MPRRSPTDREVTARILARLRSQVEATGAAVERNIQRDQLSRERNERRSGTQRRSLGDDRRDTAGRRTGDRFPPSQRSGPPPLAPPNPPLAPPNPNLPMYNPDDNEMPGDSRPRGGQIERRDWETNRRTNTPRMFEGRRIGDNLNLRREDLVDLGVQDPEAHARRAQQLMSEIEEEGFRNIRENIRNASQAAVRSNKGSLFSRARSLLNEGVERGLGAVTRTAGRAINSTQAGRAAVELAGKLGGTAAGRAVGAVASRSAVPLMVAGAAWDAAQIAREGYNAADAEMERRRNEQFMEQNYGSVEAATETRKRKERKKQISTQLREGYLLK